MNGPTETESYSYAQRQHRNRFAEGYGDSEQFGESIKTNGLKEQDTHSYVQTGAGYYSQPVPVPGFVATAAATAGNVNLKGAEGKEKIIEA